MFKSRLNKPVKDCVYFGDTCVEIPKLTVAKWKALFEAVETLPRLLVNVLSARGTDEFVASAVVATSLALDEIVKVVAVLTGLDPKFIEENADHNEIIEFIVKTAQKNDLERAAKNFQSVLGLVRKTPNEGGKEA